MPARMWRHGIHSFFDLLYRLPMSVAPSCPGSSSVPIESADSVVVRLSKLGA